jgi:hypothetical protein
LPGNSDGIKKRISWIFKDKLAKRIINIEFVMILFQGISRGRIPLEYLLENIQIISYN